MTFNVRERRKAKADKRQIFEWLYERSRSGAVAWLAAYDKMTERLKAHADTFTEAYENATTASAVSESLRVFASGNARTVRV